MTTNFDDLTARCSVRLPDTTDPEKYVLGVVLRAPHLIAQAGNVPPEAFSYPIHAVLWQALLEEYRKTKKPPVPFAVVDRLSTNDEVRREIAATVANAMDIPFAANGKNLDQFAGHLLDRWSRRRLVDLAFDFARQAVDLSQGMDAAQLAHNFTKEFIGSYTGNTDIVPLSDAITSVANEMEHGAPCHSTGLRRLDTALQGGLYSHRLYAFLARPKEGKSSLLTTISYNLANLDQYDDLESVPHVFMTLEQRKEEIAQTLVARYLRFNREQFLDPRFARDPRQQRKIRDVAEIVKGCGLHLVAKPRMVLSDVVTTISRMALKGEIKGAIVDYMQLIGGDARDVNMVAHLDHVAQSMAELAKSLGIWILLAGQLNQSGTARYGDGLLMACDAGFNIEYPEGMTDQMWLKMFATRYTRWRNVGSELQPAYLLEKDVGPYFHEQPVRQHMEDAA